MKKIAVPVVSGKLSAHFGHCKHFAIAKVENKKIIHIEEFEAPEHQPGSYPGWVAEQGVTDVIAGGIGPKAVELFNQFGINVFIGAPSLPVQQIIEDFLYDRLELNANLCDHTDGRHHQYN
ncbi:MAG: NifB/NifX family molybdenum-iron cluster-binding protein [Bacteroidales bacterium]|jgi:predicted Fe-Mo cluster-binding NifX family protein|nr:NifB/NifX family molybdenum-iron cluster-binding protein [Bacteroidales bacterium]MCK9449314.1 NifB/NifX family molybdenum-iron cluster-binding protein [Bacteroidales bacterium]MDD3701809.1 NifB/NifX family molybdenum-iron cluster-binding protein [Bacteroidales bacterium]MDY0369745.1 NifB/NifX family molybdenum-iron cluster-binding protein [Bacteroidales bacterium]